MDFFQDNYKPLKIEIQERNEQDEKGNVIKEGKKHIIITKPLTLKVTKKIAENKKRIEEEPEFAAESIYQTLELMIDKPRGFWTETDFSLAFLTDLIKYISAKANEKKN